VDLERDYVFISTVLIVDSIEVLGHRLFSLSSSTSTIFGVSVVVDDDVVFVVHIHLLLMGVMRLVIERGHQRHRISIVNADTSGAIQ
jgi:hypothetical protein